MSDNATPGLSRRAIVALGAATLLSGCATRLPPAGTSFRTPGATSPTPQTPPAPSGSATGPPVRPSMPVAGRCPTNPEVTNKPGNPQQYLPCHGTDIALTIDDGPDPVYTPKILALLERYGIRATFCVIGRNAAAHPNLVARVSGAGHHVANHTFTHPLDLSTHTPAQIRAEIDRASEAITTASGGTHPRLFRAPGGTWSQPIIAACTAAGMRPLDWSVDPRDWSLPGVDHIVQTILTRTHPGAIILDHDGGGNRQQTVDALTIALPRLLDAGFHFAQP